MSYAHPTCQFFGRQRARSLKSLARFPVRLFSKTFQGLAKPSHPPLTSQKGSARMFWFVELHGGRLAALLSAFFLTTLSFSSYAAPHADARSVLEQKPRPSIQAADLAKQSTRISTRNAQSTAFHRSPGTTRFPGSPRVTAATWRRENTSATIPPRGRVLRYRRSGYTCRIRVSRTTYGGAENIALGNLYDSVTTVNGVAHYDWNSPEKIAGKALEGWMKSPGHQENILTPQWKREGIGVGIAPTTKSTSRRIFAELDRTKDCELSRVGAVAAIPALRDSQIDVSREGDFPENSPRTKLFILVIAVRHTVKDLEEILHPYFLAAHFD